MKVILDEGLPRRAATLLREAGMDAVHVTEIAEAGRRTWRFWSRHERADKSS